jgi:hypothetical protein
MNGLKHTKKMGYRIGQIVKIHNYKGLYEIICVNKLYDRPYKIKEVISDAIFFLEESMIQPLTMGDFFNGYVCIYEPNPTPTRIKILSDLLKEYYSHNYEKIISKTKDAHKNPYIYNSDGCYQRYKDDTYAKEKVIIKLEDITGPIEESNENESEKEMYSYRSVYYKKLYDNIYNESKIENETIKHNKKEYDTEKTSEGRVPNIQRKKLQISGTIVAGRTIRTNRGKSRTSTSRPKGRKPRN